MVYRSGQTLHMRKHVSRQFSLKCLGMVNYLQQHCTSAISFDSVQHKEMDPIVIQAEILVYVNWGQHVVRTRFFLHLLQRLATTNEVCTQHRKENAYTCSQVQHDLIQFSNHKNKHDTTQSNNQWCNESLKDWHKQINTKQCRTNTN